MINLSELFSKQSIEIINLSRENNFLLKYHYSDGLTERLLGITLFIFEDHSYKLYYEFNKLSLKKEYRKYESRIDNCLPSKVSKLVNELANEKIEIIKQSYPQTKIHILDVPYHDYKINISGRTIETIITSFSKLTNSEFKNRPEKKLLELHLEINAWTKQFYSKLNDD